MLRACVKSLLDAENMCPKPTWCWEHVPKAYLIEHELSHRDVGVVRWFVGKVHYLFRAWAVVILVLLLEARVFPLKHAHDQGVKKLIVSFSYFLHWFAVLFFSWSWARVGQCVIFQGVSWKVSFPFNTLQDRVGLSLHEEDVSLAWTRSPSIPFKHT